MPKPPPPPAHVREAKSDLRRAYKAAQNERKDWNGLRYLMSKAESDETRAMHAEAIGLYTLRMWTAEAALETAAARWREVLAERAAMPVTDRWDLAALERWAAALDKAGAP
jgi:hypothetical protein